MTNELKSLTLNGKKYSSFVDEEARKNTGGGGANIDVVAQVGQTIVVKEVGENGKPTAWEAVDYQPRTHWQGEKVMLPERTVEAGIDNDGNLFLYTTDPMGLTVGKTYKVVFNGVTYTCVAEARTGSLFDETYEVISIGNLKYVGGDDNGLPFILCDIPTYDPPTAFFLPYTYGTHTLSVTGVDETNAIPVKYLSEGFPYIVKMKIEIVDNKEVYSCTETFDELMAIFNSGREIKVKCAPWYGTTLEIYYNLYCTEGGDSFAVLSFAANSIFKNAENLYITMIPQGDSWRVIPESPFALAEGTTE